MHLSRFVAVVVVGAALASSSCNAVLGIDRATLDPESSDASLGAPDVFTLEGGGAFAPCESYCNDIMTACTGGLQEYLSRDVCIKMCSSFEPGLSTDQAGDSRACRAYHAKAALENPAIHCRHAGPLGAGVCGDNACAPFCLLTVAHCGGGESSPYPGGEGPCRTACKDLVYDLSANSGDLSKTEGPTLNCRLYHLQAAYEANNPLAMTTHCPHTALVSAVCH